MLTSLKNTFNLIIIGILISGISGSLLFYKKYKKEKDERIRIERNWIAQNDTIRTYKTRTGWLAQELSIQEIRHNELKKINLELYDDISDLKIKLKNAKSITKIETKIEYINKDSIVYVEVGFGKRNFIINEKDNWFNANITITDGEYIAPGDAQLETRDSLIIVPDIKYKGWWFWKKIDRVSVTVANKNPYSKNSIQHYDIKK